MSKPAGRRDTLTMFDEVSQGRILWLPKLEDVIRTSTLRGRETLVTDMSTGNDADTRIYDHPIMVLSRPDDDPDHIYFLLVCKL
jgi:hypothetical protein